VIKPAARLAKEASKITSSASNEAQLRHELEKALEKACESLSIAWTPYQLERSVKGASQLTKFMDVIHGAIIIEYEPPSSFSGIVGARLKHARQQAEEYAELISAEEGRAITEYVLVAWDGSHINFGRLTQSGPKWESLRNFDPMAAERLLEELRQNGIPLVHPRLLAVLAGPDSEHGKMLIPLFFTAIQASLTTKAHNQDKATIH
jgi:hypothetical protein